MKVSILELLRGQGGQWLGVEALADALGVSPAEVHRMVDELRQLGHEIEAHPVHGFSLVKASGKLTAELIEYGLETVRIGRKVLVYESTDSTNDVAWQHSEEVGYDGLAVFAEKQLKGRGRLGRQWDSPGGKSILCSILLQDERSVSGQALSLLAGLAPALAVEDCFQLPVRISWPNDVIVDGRKLAGTMIESQKIKNKLCYVIGIGINCFQRREEFDPSLRDRAVSLCELTSEPVDRVRLAQGLLTRIDEGLRLLATGQAEKLHELWMARCGDIGRRIAVMSDGREFAGRVIDVSCEEGLILQLDGGGVRAFDSATTSLVK